jgi:hypothetical protein
VFSLLRISFTTQIRLLARFSSFVNSGVGVGSRVEGEGEEGDAGEGSFCSRGGMRKKEEEGGGHPQRGALVSVESVGKKKIPFVRCDHKLFLPHTIPHLFLHNNCNTWLWLAGELVILRRGCSNVIVTSSSCFSTHSYALLS